MQRNLDHRIEVVVPVEAPHVRAEIETIFRRLLADNSQAWLMAPGRLVEHGHSRVTANGGGHRNSWRCAAGCAHGGVRRRGRDSTTCGPGNMDPCWSA